MQFSGYFSHAGQYVNSAIEPALAAGGFKWAVTFKGLLEKGHGIYTFIG